MDIFVYENSRNNFIFNKSPIDVVDTKSRLEFLIKQDSSLISTAFSPVLQINVRILIRLWVGWRLVSLKCLNLLYILEETGGNVFQIKFFLSIL